MSPQPKLCRNCKVKEAWAPHYSVCRDCLGETEDYTDQDDIAIRVDTRMRRGRVGARIAEGFGLQDDGD